MGFSHSADTVAAAPTGEYRYQAALDTSQADQRGLPNDPPSSIWESTLLGSPVPGAPSTVLPLHPSPSTPHPAPEPPHPPAEPLPQHCISPTNSVGPTHRRHHRPTTPLDAPPHLIRIASPHPRRLKRIASPQTPTHTPHTHPTATHPLGLYTHRLTPFPAPRSTP